MIATAALAIAAAASRIISLSPATTEDLFAVGATSQIVGIDEYATRPKAVARFKRFGGIFTANAELVMAARPSLVLYQEPNEPAMEALRRANLDVAEMPGVSLQDDWDAIAAVGRLSGHARTADALVARLRAHIESRAREAAHMKRLRVLLVTWQSPVYTDAKGTLLDDLFNLANLQNVAEDAGTPWAQISDDFVATSNPDVVMLSGEDWFRFDPTLPPFDFMPAVRNKRFAHMREEIECGPYVDRLFDAILDSVAPFRT